MLEACYHKAIIVSILEIKTKSDVREEDIVDAVILQPMKRATFKSGLDL